VTPDDFYAQTLSELDQRLLETLCRFVLFPGGVNTLDMYQVWPEMTDRQQIASLVERRLLEDISQDQSLYSLSLSVRHYIESHYARDDRLKSTINDLIIKMGSDSQLSSLKVVEQILLSSWLEIDLKWYSRWIKNFWREGVRQGHCAKWCDILEDYLRKTGSEDVPLLTAYGRCLGRLTEWSAAENTFRHVLQLTGKTGDFISQAACLLELAVFYRHQGHYENAQRLFTQVEAILQNYDDRVLASALCLQQAQMALDIGDFEEAIRALSTIETPSPSLLALKSEAFLQNGDWKQSLDFARLALEMDGITRTLEAHLNSVTGRAYEKIGEFSLARGFLESAVTLLEQMDDRFTLARAQSNLGAILIREKAYNEAQRLLEQASRVQTQFKDQVGLATTTHNLRLLHIARVGSRS
jgi:tetratricopeptide (TPR) repeat protein